MIQKRSRFEPAPPQSTIFSNAPVGPLILFDLTLKNTFTSEEIRMGLLKSEQKQTWGRGGNSSWENE